MKYFNHLKVFCHGIAGELLPAGRNKYLNFIFLGDNVCLAETSRICYLIFFFLLEDKSETAYCYEITTLRKMSDICKLNKSVVKFSCGSVRVQFNCKTILGLHPILLKTFDGINDNISYLRARIKL